MKWVILFSGILANAFASVLVKVAMMPPRKFPSFSDPLSALTNWPFWIGLAFYGVAFLLYAAALARLPLNVAHPILTSGAIAMVAIFSLLLFKERFYITTIVGIIFVLLGVILITVKPNVG